MKSSPFFTNSPESGRETLSNSLLIQNLGGCLKYDNRLAPLGPSGNISQHDRFLSDPFTLNLQALPWEEMPMM